MKIGHSNVLGHMLEAEDVTQQAIRDLVIVCPECRSPVYKIQRAAGDADQHFLAHFPAQRDTAKECELRVARYASGAARESEESERKGHLRFFLAALDEMVGGVMERIVGMDDAQLRVMAAIRRSKNVWKLRQEVVALLAEETDGGRDRLGLDEEGSFKAGLVADPVLGYQRQKRFADDMFATLRRPECRTAYANLQMHAWLATMHYFQDKAPGDPREEPLVLFMASFTSDDYQGTMRHHAALARTDITYMKQVFASYIRQILLGIDYGDWLRRRRDDARLLGLKWKPDAIIVAPPKRKPRPKATHRKAKPGRRRAA